eukprot:TRINITY_DN4773_c0_g1_i1.p1 TRINITY_DN4773_c0_g1~~TRINITY_DN4773_c0_g1_i1.p1  ORF type:complete len:221 (-),score=57.32 TRINITY_DN4773_c0_g1_i1:107-769(-)
MAPEIIRGQPYGLEVDMWAIGVTAFVMMGGYVPFDGENDSEVFASILGLKYTFQSPEWDHVGPDGRDFIISLLKISPLERMTAREALVHPFITKFSPEVWRMVPPLLSDVSSPSVFSEQEISSVMNLHVDEKSRGKQKDVVSAIYEKLDLSKNPKQVVLDKIGVLMKLSKGDEMRTGELRFMKTIIGAVGSSGNSSTKLEMVLLEETWCRLNFLHSTFKK